LIRPDGSPLTIGEVKRRINLWLAERGVENPDGTIFAIGRDSAVPHSAGTPTDLLRLGQTIIFDIFPCEAGGGYFYDFTRTWCLGYAPDEALALFEDVSAVYHHIRSQMRLGAPCKDYQPMAWDLFEARGHPTQRSQPGTLEGYVHGLGHGVGLQVHESPSFSIFSPDSERLEPGVVITVEPGYITRARHGCASGRHCLGAARWRLRDAGRLSVGYGTSDERVTSVAGQVGKEKPTAQNSIVRILGVETSCDETAAALVENGRFILSNLVASQVDLHAQFGGVFPEVASRQHIRTIYTIIEEALQQAHLCLEDIDAIAVTRGPGLPGSLVIGINTAKGMALGADLPIVGVNHLEAHIYSAWLHWPPLANAAASEAEAAKRALSSQRPERNFRCWCSSCRVVTPS